MRSRIMWMFFVVVFCVFGGLRQTAAQAPGFVSVEDAARNALNVGAKAPEFSLKDSTGKVVSSKELLKQGRWC